MKKKWKTNCPLGAKDFDSLLQMIADGEHDINVPAVAKKLSLEGDFSWDEISFLIQNNEITADEVDKIIHRTLR